MIPLDKTFTIDIIGVKAPTGSGKSVKVLDYSKDTHIKKSIITIRNKDNLCCGRAIAVGKALADNHTQLKQLKMGRPIQKQIALKLYKKANIFPGPCGLREISKFQGSLPVKNVSHFFRTILLILVLIHATLACVGNVFWFLIKNALVRTVSKFVVRLNVLSITKSLANRRELICLRNVRHHLNVKRVQ